MFERLVQFQETTHYKKPETYLSVNTSPRRTSSLPDIIENRFNIIEDENELRDTLSDNQLKFNRSDNCIVSIVPHNSDSQPNVNAIDVKNDLIERRKIFFVDLNSDTKLQVTSV